MRSLLSRALFLGSVASIGLLAGCSAVLGFEDLTLGAADASVADASDAGAVDSSLSDSAKPDSSSSDASSTDSSLVDAAVDSTSVDAADSSVSDTAPADTAPDTSATDSSVADTNPDTGLADTATDTASPDTSVVDSALPDVVNDTAPDQNTCGDTTTDPHNCGSCGHDCLGGDCLSGKCQPVVLASKLNTPKGLALDSKYAFVADVYEHRVYRHEFGKSGAETLASVDYATSPWGVQVYGDHVLWSNRDHSLGSIARCPKSGCTASSFVNLIPGLKKPQGIAIAGDVVVWAESSGGRVGRASAIDGSGVKYLYEDAAANPADVAVLGKYVYFVDYLDGQVRRVPLAGGVHENLAGDELGAYTVHAMATGVFWTEQNMSGVGSLRFIPVSASDVVGKATSYASGLLSPAGIATDSQYVYLLVSGSTVAATGELVYCPLTGCPSGWPKPIATGLSRPSRVVVAGSAIYWTESGLDNLSLNGSLKMIAKP